MDLKQNFCLPLRDLENDRVRLTIFNPAIHAEPFVEAALKAPDLWTYIPIGPFPSVQTFIDDLYIPRIVNNAQSCLYAIIDKTTSISSDAHSEILGGKMAGIIGFLNTQPEHLKTELGFIVILPSFQRTHVTSNAMGILLHYALDLPEKGGLGLRRVAWQSNEHNAASIKAAQRMGFVLEGVLRWERVFRTTATDGWNGVKLREGDALPEYPGRNTVMLSLCWDDWDLVGAKEKCDAAMAREL